MYMHLGMHNLVNITNKVNQKNSNRRIRIRQWNDH